MVIVTLCQHRRETYRNAVLMCTVYNSIFDYLPAVEYKLYTSIVPVKGRVHSIQCIHLTKSIVVAGRPGISEVPRNPLTRWDVSSIPANGIFLTKKLKNKNKNAQRVEND